MIPIINVGVSLSPTSVVVVLNLWESASVPDLGGSADACVCMCASLFFLIVESQTARSSSRFPMPVILPQKLLTRDCGNQRTMFG